MVLFCDLNDPIDAAITIELFFNKVTFGLGVGPVGFPIGCFAYKINDFFPHLVHAWR